MPLFPTSQVADVVGATGIPPDIIVVRGYVGGADPLEYANRLLTQAGQAPIPAHAPLDTLLQSANAPGRIYLSAELDCWVEVNDWDAMVIDQVAEQDTDRTDAFTVWLRARDLNTQVPLRYRVVSNAFVDTRAGNFISGRLLEDFMSSGDSSNVVWDEQLYGPTTGLISRTRCF